MTYGDGRKRETIAAPASGQAKAGIAVVRISGPLTRFAVETLSGPLPSPRRASLRTIRSPRSGVGLIDQGLVIWFPGPASYTGEDMAEFQVHGGRGVVEALMEALRIDAGVGLAEPGAFTRRAFENGRMDLVEVEAVADLIDSETERQRRQAVRQLGGAFSRTVGRWRGELLRARVLAEAAIDFVDEDDVSADALAQARRIGVAVAEELRTVLARSGAGRRVRDGFRIVIAGPTNAGKSSLFNALAERDIAITSSVPGTTRDALEVHLDIDGYPVTLVDTAGLRATEDVVEQLGIGRSRAHIGTADLVLWISPALTPAMPEAPEGKVLDVRSKTDLGGAAGEGDVGISIGDAASIDRLLGLIAARVSAAGGGDDGALITRLRHEVEVRKAVAALAGIGLEQGAGEELVAESLRVALDAVGRITGAVGVEEVLGSIFSTFCIGK